MKITKEHLRNVVKEEINNFLKENFENMEEARVPRDAYGVRDEKGVDARKRDRAERHGSVKLKGPEQGVLPLGEDPPEMLTPERKAELNKLKKEVEKDPNLTPFQRNYIIKSINRMLGIEDPSIEA